VALLAKKFSFNEFGTGARIEAVVDRAVCDVAYFDPQGPIDLLVATGIRPRLLPFKVEQAREGPRKVRELVEITGDARTLEPPLYNNILDGSAP